VIAHFAKYRSLMPALALLFHVIDCVDRGTGGPVSETATERARAWCAYLEAHARRVYQSLTAWAQVAATQLANKIMAGQLGSPFLARQVRRRGWAGLSTTEETFAGLDILEELHWLRREDVPPTAKGGRSTARYHINPPLERPGDE
jgi:ferric-dicitrate binding protein FerR (iron transport regulator)